MVHGKLNPTFTLIRMVLMVVVFHDVSAALQTTFMEDICYGKKSVIVDLRFQPTGILMSLPQTELTQSFECEVILAPPRESSVVVSIYRFDVSSSDLLTIEDSDRFKIALTGYSFFKDEKKAIISEGRTAIHYRRNVSESSHPRQGFQFTFTAVKKYDPCYDNEFQCDNRLCILKQFVCDGHNHCGDRSDQKNCVPKKDTASNIDREVISVRKNTHIVWISIIAVAGAIVFIIVIVFIVVVVRLSKSRKQKAPTAENNNNQNSGRNVPLQSVSSTVPQQQSSAPTSGVTPSAPPASECEGFSFYNRIRRSLRGAKNPKTEEVSKNEVTSEVYQVPSMYPNLDHPEVAAPGGGIENPEFKNDE